MMQKIGRASLLGGVSALAMMALVTDAHAGFISGSGWVTTNANASNAAKATLSAADCNQLGIAGACVAANTAVTFTTNALNFDSQLNGSTTIGGFLSSNPVGETGIAFHNGASAATSMSPTLWEFTGAASFTNGQKFIFNHDDGVTMIVNGVTILSQPGPTSPTTNTATYTGATGNFSFDIVYGECCGPPAVLKTTLVGPLVPTPEPASLALLGSALAGIGVAMRRRRKT